MRYIKLGMKKLGHHIWFFGNQIKGI